MREIIVADDGGSDGAAVVLIETGLQDPPKVIPKLIARWSVGLDVVRGRSLSFAGVPMQKLTPAHHGHSKADYAFLMMAELLLGGVNSGTNGIIGEYVCSIFTVPKLRPFRVVTKTPSPATQDTRGDEP